MKKFSLTVLFILLASPAWATTFFLAPASGGGNDSNNGTSASTPWLSPNHAVNCGDVIIAAASTAYSAANFSSGRWGTVTCPGDDNVAWLKCATFDACKISAPSSDGMQISSSYWGVQGWEITTTGGSASDCFAATPPNSSTSIHHIVFANDIATGCTGNGFDANYNNGAGTDYIAYVGSIAYKAASGSGVCASGLNIVNPTAHDSASGTHDYVAGNFSWLNVNPNPCAGTAPTDGEGIILDSIFTNGYTQQMVIYNNIAIGNGGRGIEVLNNNSGSGARIYIKNNTTWGNETQTSQAPGGSFGEIYLFQDQSMTVTANIAMTTRVNGPAGYPYYAYVVDSGTSTSTASGNVGYSASGNNAISQYSNGFSFGTNLFGMNPNFSTPSIPGPPNCGSATSVPNCMATVISNFTPSGSAVGYGYQVPATGNVADGLFPQWLCNVNLPSGLVTMGCLSSSSPSSSPAPPTNVSATVN
ncbi:MAG: hypothetical protein WCA19_11900 [Candidatus Acidiferrales bacterium]